MADADHLRLLEAAGVVLEILFRVRIGRLDLQDAADDRSGDGRGGGKQHRKQAGISEVEESSVHYVLVLTVQRLTTFTFWMSGSFSNSASTAGGGSLSRWSTVNAWPPTVSRLRLMLAMLT